MQQRGNRTMSYAMIDATISDWAARHSLPLYTHFGDRAARFVYISSEIGECFQISIAEPHAGTLQIVASSVETEGDEELSEAWETGVEELREALEGVLDAVYQWMRRHDNLANAVKLKP